MKISLVFYFLVFLVNLFATPIADSITLKKIEKLIQKEEDIAKAYKEYLLKNGVAPTTIKVLIDNGFLPKGFKIENLFGGNINFVSGKSQIAKFTTSNLNLNSTLNYYYYTDTFRELTKSSQKSDENIDINLNLTEKFIFDNQSIISNNKAIAKTKTGEGGYYIENGVLSWLDTNGNYKFSIAKDIISKDKLVIEGSNNSLNTNLITSTNKLSSLMYIGKKIYQPNTKNSNELDEFLNLGKRIVKTENLQPTVIIIKSSQNGSGVIVNGDVYIWGNNAKRTLSVGTNSYTKDAALIGTGIPIINNMIRARAINYTKEQLTSSTVLDYRTIKICNNVIDAQGSSVEECEVETSNNHLNTENLYSSSLRTKFTNMYLDNSKSICAISDKNELFCGGEDVLENNYISFIGYKKDNDNTNNKNIDYLYKSGFFNGADNFISDILFVGNTYLALGRNKNDSALVSKLYFWGENNLGGWAGTGLNTEKNIITPTEVTGYEFSNIFYNSTLNKIVALSKNGNIFIWGGLQAGQECADICKPKILDLGKDFLFKSLEQKSNAIIANSRIDEKPYKITIKANGEASKKLVQDDINLVSKLDEDKSILSFDYTTDGIIWVNSNNKLKGNFTGADILFNKTISQISWEKIKVIGSNNGICGIDTNKQMYCWGDLSNSNNDGFVIPIFGSNLQDINRDFIFLEKNESGVTSVTSGDWLINNSKYFIKYPTFIGGFNYDVDFK